MILNTGIGQLQPVGQDILQQIIGRQLGAEQSANAGVLVRQASPGARSAYLILGNPVKRHVPLALPFLPPCRVDQTGLLREIEHGLVHRGVFILDPVEQAFLAFRLVQTVLDILL